MAIHKITISGEVFKLIPLGQCACGCGKELILADERGRPRRFFPGHHRPKRKYVSPGLHQDTRFCYCGKQLDKWHKRFCTIKCQEQYSKEKLQIKRVCKYCEKEFIIRKATLKTNASGNFCSRQCYNNYQKTLTGELNNSYNRISCKCDYCGISIEVIPFKYESYNNHFCSLKCKHRFHRGKYAGEANPFWKGGHSKYRGDFSTVKLIHFKKKQWCAYCGTFKRIHIHHIIPYRLTQDNHLSNLIPLCIRCHKKVEMMTWQMIEGNFDNDLGIAKFLLNCILRERQMLTCLTLLEIKDKIAA